MSDNSALDIIAIFVKEIDFLILSVLRSTDSPLQASVPAMRMILMRNMVLVERDDHLSVRKLHAVKLPHMVSIP